jgi:hypothetical protein
MAELSITITPRTELDYDSIDETTKHLTATIDGVELRETMTVPDTTADADAKAAFRGELTAKGYDWDTEV